jgi:two-component system nitrogen regulation sensor histidine kinase GlnL
VLVIDAELRLTYVNPAAENLLGVSYKQLLTKRISEVLWPADELVSLCERSFATRLTYGLREFRTRASDRELVLDCHASPLDAPDTDRGSTLVLELIDTEPERRIRRESELKAQQQLSRRIVGQLAHEVKNPLGGLRGAAQLLERQLPSPALREYTRVIIEEADRLAALVDGILQAGGRGKPERLNVHEITEHVFSLIGAEKPEVLSLLRDYDPSLPPLTADRGQLIQAVLNLARNAMQALRERGGRIVFRTRALHNYALGGELYRLVVSIEIEDNGPGIAEDLQQTVFYPLVSGRADGSGLGLTIAQDLVSRNSGLIEFTSRPGCTVFKVRIPVQRNGTAEKQR